MVAKKQLEPWDGHLWNGQLLVGLAPWKIVVVKKQLELWDGHLWDGRQLVGVAGTSLEDCGSEEAVGWTPVGWTPAEWTPVGGIS